MTNEMPAPLVLPALSDELLATLFALADNTAPHECAGWLCGTPRTLTRLYVATHGSHTAFAFEAHDLLRFANAFLNASEPPRIVFHSHPSGAPELSVHDIDAALGPNGQPLYPVDQLVLGRSLANRYRFTNGTFALVQQMPRRHF